MQIASINKVNLFLRVGLLVCLIGGIFFYNQALISVSPDRIAERVSSKLENELYALDKIADGYRKQWDQEKTITLEPSEHEHFFFVSGYEIQQWTNNHFLPNARLVWDDFEVKYLKTGAGDFLLRKWPLDEEKFLVAIIPLQIHYKIQNEYLEPRLNKNIFSGFSVEILDANSSRGQEVRVHGKTVFKFLLLSNTVSDFTSGVLAVTLLSLAGIAFLVLVYRSKRNVWRKFPGISFLMLVGGVLMLRYLMISYQFPNRFFTAELFDPKYFASSSFNPSLGDLVFNSIGVTIICLIFFRNYYRFEGLRVALHPGITRWGLSVFASMMILFAALLPYVLIQTIYNNSSITLNISQSIEFDHLRILAFSALVLSWICSFLVMHVFIRILVNDKKHIRIIFSLLISVVLFVLINEWTNQVYVSSLWTGLGYILVVVSLKLYKSLRYFRYGTFIYFLLAVAGFSINGVLAANHFSDVKKAQDQFRFANAFLVDRDDFGEFLISEAIQKISGDLFIQTRLSGPFVNKDAVRQKIRQIFIPGYFNKYNVEIHLFGPSGDAMDEASELNYTTWSTSIQQNSTPTAYEGVYFMNRELSESARKYNVIIPIRRNELNAGFIILELSLKKIIPDNVYPELLVDNRFQQAFRSQDFSYAVFTDRDIQFRSGEFNYAALDKKVINDSRFYKNGVTAHGYRHIGLKDSTGRLVIVSSPAPSQLFLVADLSFLITIGLFVIMVYLLAVGIVSFIRGERLMMAARIQLILNISFFIPLIGISVITIGQTARANQQQLNAEYISKSRNFSNEIIAQISEQRLAEGFVYEQNFAQLAKVSSLDANLFTPGGKLQLASQPLIFENQLLAPFINPNALARIHQGDRQFVLDERVGNLDYFVAYSALHSPDDGSLLGIAAVPFFQSAYLLEKMQINVFANVLSIFTAIFIVLLFISHWISRWLTFPLRMITQKLGRISLTQSNQPLEWHSDDEIGIMVREYNQMLSSLSESKNELERTQRERAWREIAQQVAHEIKNPLTPMKLTLQKLEKLSADDPQSFEKFKKAISSILSQVDTLDGVASSFSTFAKMPEPVMRKTELIGLIKNVVQLHRQTATIEFSTDREQINVLIDDQLFSRIVSNIILNSAQAARHDSPLKIEVAIKRSGPNVILSFADNGIGVEESLKDAVFLPHFSTKKSGSGLGLAIARQGIEQMGGKIYFTSVADQGTIFYVQLPYLDED